MKRQKARPYHSKPWFKKKPRSMDFRGFDPTVRYTSSLYSRAKNYKVTEEELRACAEYQNFRCAICLEPSNISNAFAEAKLNQLCIDHNHATNEVRGILCRACNYAIGVLRDDQVILRRAADYIQQPIMRKVREHLEA